MLGFSEALLVLDNQISTNVELLRSDLRTASERLNICSKMKSE